MIKQRMNQNLNNFFWRREKDYGCDEDYIKLKFKKGSFLDFFDDIVDSLFEINNEIRFKSKIYYFI